MTTLFSATSSADFLAIVPDLLGQNPTNSVVIVAFRRFTSAGALRCDLPSEADDHRSIAAHLIGQICKIPRADGVAVVVYSSERHHHDRLQPDRFVAPRAAFVESIVTRCSDSGLLVHDILWVSERYWGVYGVGADGASADLGETTPQPLSMVDDSTLNQTLKQRTDRTVLRDLEEESTFYPADPLRRADVRRCLDLLSVPDREANPDDPRPRTAPERPTGCHGEDTVEQCAIELLRAFTDAGPGEILLLPPHWVAVFGTSVVCPRVCEELLTQWAWGSSTLRSPELSSERIYGYGSTRPEVARCLAGIELLRTMGELLPGATRAPIALMLAWLHWSLGRGSLAERWVTIALSGDPHNDLGLHIESRLAAGELPDWAYIVPDDAVSGAGGLV